MALGHRSPPPAAPFGPAVRLSTGLFAPALTFPGLFDPSFALLGGSLRAVLLTLSAPPAGLGPTLPSLSPTALLSRAFVPSVVSSGLPVLLLLLERSSLLAPAVAVSALALFALVTPLLSAPVLALLLLSTLLPSTLIPRLLALASLVPGRLLLTALVLATLLLAAAPLLPLLFSGLLPPLRLVPLLLGLATLSLLLLEALFARTVAPLAGLLSVLRAWVLGLLPVLLPLPTFALVASALLSVLLLASLLRSVLSGPWLFLPSPLSVSSAGRLSSTHRYQPVWAVSDTAG